MSYERVVHGQHCAGRPLEDFTSDVATARKPERRRKPERVSRLVLILFAITAAHDLV